MSEPASVVWSMAKKVRLSCSDTAGRQENSQHSNGNHPVKNSLVGKEVDDLANWGGTCVEVFAVKW